MARTSPGGRSSDASSDQPAVTASRRSVCAGVAAVALPSITGCSALSGFLGGNPGEVTVFNDTGSTITATIAVTNLESESEALSETTDVDASGATKYDGVFESAARYRFEVETGDGLSDSYEWDLPSTDHFLYVTIGSESIAFEPMEP